MHTPDGFLTSWICYILLLTSLSIIVLSIYKMRNLSRNSITSLASIAGVIFAFQMLNFPIASGTSGHLIGAGFVAILFGPYAAVMVLTSVLLIQSVVYGDGGMLAIGANILNMGIVASFSTHYIHSMLKRTNKYFATSVSVWAGVVLASLACAIEIGLSGYIPFSQVIISMTSVHIFIGIGEAIISIGMIRIWTATERTTNHHAALFVLGGTLLMALLLPFASTHPDGLERVALNLGFFDKAVTVYPYAVFQNYTLFGSGSYIFALIAGVFGIALTYLTSLLTYKFATKTA
jgi:cobalt/nickel transport system permease protein